jgi:hypothetical protein
VKTRLAMCLALAVTCSAVAPIPASAQALLPPSEITTSVRSMGLQPITAPVLRGARYVLRAIDRRGMKVTVAADAVNGRVLFVRPVGYADRPIEGPVYADRAYPRVYPEGMAPPRGYERPRNYQQQGSYDPPDNYQQPGNYVRPPARIPGEPSVIYAPRDTANSQGANPQNPNPRAPVAAKPTPAPKVAAKPPAQSAPAAAPVEARKTEPSPEVTTGSTASSPPAAAKPSASQESASQAPASQVAATPLAPPAVPVEAAKTEPAPDTTTGSTSAPKPEEKNPGFATPPVQGFD